MDESKVQAPTTSERRLIVGASAQMLRSPLNVQLLGQRLKACCLEGERTLLIYDGFGLDEGELASKLFTVSRLITCGDPTWKDNWRQLIDYIVGLAKVYELDQSDCMGLLDEAYVALVENFRDRPLASLPSKLALLVIRKHIGAVNTIDVGLCCGDGSPSGDDDDLFEGQSIDHAVMRLAMTRVARAIVIDNRSVPRASADGYTSTATVTSMRTSHARRLVELDMHLTDQFALDLIDESKIPLSVINLTDGDEVTIEPGEDNEQRVVAIRGVPVHSVTCDVDDMEHACDVIREFNGIAGAQGVRVVSFGWTHTKLNVIFQTDVALQGKRLDDLTSHLPEWGVKHFSFDPRLAIFVVGSNLSKRTFTTMVNVCDAASNMDGGQLIDGVAVYGLNMLSDVAACLVVDANDATKVVKALEELEFAAGVLSPGTKNSIRPPAAIAPRQPEESVIVDDDLKGLADTSSGPSGTA